MTYVDVVYMQGEEGHEMVDMIDRVGVADVIAHLSHWDYGDETDDAHAKDGEPFDDPFGHTVHHDGYRLDWNSGLGTISLTRPPL